MATLHCPCCSWTIRQVDESPDRIAACSNCGQVVSVPGISSCSIPSCSTEAMVDWGRTGNPPAHDWMSLLPVELCVPLRKGHPSHAFVITGLLCIAIEIFFVVLPGFPPSRGERIVFAGVGSLFALGGVYLLYAGLRKLRCSARARLLSTAQLPDEAQQLGTPFSLHRNQSVPPPALLFLVGLFLIAASAGGVALLWIGEINDLRMLMVAICGVMLGVAAIRSAASYRPLWLLVCSNGFVVVRDRETELWRWEDIKIIHLKKTSHAPVLFSYTLRHTDGRTFTFDHRLEFIENQFGVRVQQMLCRLILPNLIHRVSVGEQAGFGPLLVSKDGLHHFEGFVRWQEVANLTLDSDQLTIRKWGGDYGASWSVPYPNIPNLAVFFALAQLFLRECANPGQSALSVLMAGSCPLDPMAIQASSSDLQSPSQLTPQF